MPKWDWTQSWRAPRRRIGWTGAIEWSRSFDAVLAVTGRRLDACLEKWDTALEDLGGDPARKDWTRFRPLRLSREEDWSDWLAELLVESATGRFAWELLPRIEGRPMASYARRHVAHREVRHEGRRADIVIEWCGSPRHYTHIEVKVGDQDLAKTLETARLMAERFGRGSIGSDVILLLPKQSGAWDEECEGQPELRKRVKLRDWRDVARALRRSLPESANESTHWRIFARALCGAIEQRLLGFSPVLKDEAGARRYHVRGTDLGRVDYLDALLKEQA